jgi:hyperosmotically inducible periplasmic protein
MLKSSTVVLISSLLFAPTLALSADDTQINARVKTALITIADDERKTREINVETKNGVVQLSGFVDSERLKAAAAATAKSVSGVKEVRNKLVVRAAG